MFAPPLCVHASCGSPRPNAERRKPIPTITSNGASLVFAVEAGLGLTLALVLMASIREDTELADVPSLAKGTALVLIIAGSLSLAFMGFAGLGSST